MSRYRLKAYFYLLVVAAIWGAAGPVIKFTLEGISPFPFLAYRFTLSGVVALLVILVKKVKIKKTDLPLIALYGILALSLSLSLLFIGIEKGTVLDLALIGALSPLLISLGGAWFFHDHITHREKIGIAIAVLGVIINSLSSAWQNQAAVRFTGNIFLLAFLLSDSSAVLLSKKILRKKIPTLKITLVSFVVAALTLPPLVILAEGPSVVFQVVATLPLKYHLGVWYMAFVSGLLAYFLAIAGEKSIEISETALFYYLQPLFSIPLAIFWLKEAPSHAFLLGAFIIALGVYIAETKAKKKRRASPRSEKKTSSTRLGD